MPIISDYHMHTPLCGHATGEPAEYAGQALARELTEIGFSDHLPLLAHDVPDIAMSKDELPMYHRMIAEVRDAFAGRLTIRTGIEADYVPGYEQPIKELITAYPYDYVIGSVHFIGDWGFDNPAERRRWDQADIDAVYRNYYDLLRQSARCRLFDIMGHVDLVKKFGNRPGEDMTGEITATAQAFRESGVTIEINTAGLRKPVREIYPSLTALKIYQQAGVPITFGSDSHRPEEVGQDFDRARDLALAAGYRDYVVFANRQIRDRIAL